jgi:hypothetical protein
LNALARVKPIRHGIRHSTLRVAQKVQYALGPIKVVAQNNGQ